MLAGVIFPVCYCQTMFRKEGNWIFSSLSVGLASLMQAKKEMQATTGSKDIIRHLNTILRNELTAINQYFLHARMLKHMGFMKLADYEYKESIEEMRHADQLVERILFLGGVPNLQDLGKLFIGETVEEIVDSDLKLEEKGAIDLRAAITLCEASEDYVSSGLLETIQKNEEEHVDFLRRQKNLIKTLGITAYLQTQV